MIIISEDLYNMDLSLADEVLKKNVHDLSAKIPLEDCYPRADDLPQLLEDLEVDVINTVIFDLGCEAGNMGYAFYREGWVGDVVAVDIHEPTLQMAEDRKVYCAAYLVDCSSREDVLMMLADFDGFTKICIAYDLIEHMPLDLVGGFMEVIHLFDVAFLSTPATTFGMESSRNPYDQHVRCYDPVVQMREWNPVCFWRCAPGGQFYTIHSCYNPEYEMAMDPTPLRFRGSFSRNDVYKRLRFHGIEVGRNYKKSLSAVRACLSDCASDL